jgi:hypothetical protein
MKKILKGTLLIVLLPILLISCEQMFTHSLFEWAQRDPSNLSEAQQVSYAQSVLGSGDKDAMTDAYEAIKDNSDPEVQLLAAKLAVGASGLNEAVESAIADLDAIEDGSKSIEDYLNTIDAVMLTNVADRMSEALDDPSTKESVTSEDYVTVAAAIVISKVSDGTVNDLDSDVDFESDFDAASYGGSPDKDSTDWKEQTAFYIQQSGYESTDLDSLVNLNA